MKNPDQINNCKNHLSTVKASPWVMRFAPIIPKNGPSCGKILDLAAGNGRHTKYFHNLGHPVIALDQDVSSLDKFRNYDDIRVIQANLETSQPGCGVFFDGQKREDTLSNELFAGIVVVNYLHRPLLLDLVRTLEPGGVLIYETFAYGNEKKYRPKNPDYLLKSGELLELARGRLQVVAYEHGIITTAETEGVKQRLCAINNLKKSNRLDGEPHPILVPRPPLPSGETEL